MTFSLILLATAGTLAACGGESPSGTSQTCISSGTGADIQGALNDGQNAVLCQGATFELTTTLDYTADGQSIFTEGRPTGEDRAILKIASSEIASAVREVDNTNVTLESVIVDGNREEFGYAEGDISQNGLLIFGRDARGATIENVRARDTRSWTTLHLPHWAGSCTDMTVRSSTFGPAGTADGRWADGISLACKQSQVVGNRIVDATDGAIVVFGAAGSVIENNTIVARNRVLLGGINMVDDNNEHQRNYTDTRVVGNTIRAEGALIKIALGMGPPVWGRCFDSSDRVYGATVRNNILEGDHMGYGFVVDGVEDWTVVDNTDRSTHVGTPEGGCDMPPPQGFLINGDRSVGTFQSEFEDPGVSLHAGLTLTASE